MTIHRELRPEGWPRARGYADGISAEGRTLFLAGQVGWDQTGTFHSPDFVVQLRQLLLNIRSILTAGGAGPEHIVRMTWFILDKAEYLASLKEVGAAYREILGRHYPAMSVVVVKDLIEDGARLEIEVTAVVPS